MKGIRGQMLLLVAGALLPLIAFVGWTLYGQHIDLRDHLRQEAEDEANLLRASIDSHLHLTEAVLTSLTPLALRGEGALANADLQRVVTHLPPYANNIMSFDANGAFLDAYQRPSSRSVNEGIAHRTYFKEAVHAPGVIASEPIRTSSSGRRLFKSALAYRAADGHVAGVLVMTTDVDILEAQLLDPLVQRRLNVAVVTPAGKTVMRTRGSAPIDATRSPLREALGAPTHHGEIDGPEGPVAFAAATASRAPLTVIVLGDGAFVAGEQLRHSLMIFAALIAVSAGFVFALCLSRRISRPLFVLRDAADALGRGDLRHRVPQLAAEAGKVGRAFNAMAEQVEAQRAIIREDAERFRAVFERCPLTAAISDFETGALLDVNAMFTEVTGLEASDVIGKTTGQIGLWIDPAQREAALRLLKTHGRLEAFECKHRVRDGRIVDFLLFGEIMTLGGRRLILSQGVDVTELKRAERQIREVTRRLTHATRAARMGVWDLDLRSRRLTWDETMLELYRTVPQDFGGRFEDWLRFVPAEDRAGLERCRVESLGGVSEIDIQHRAQLADGNMRHMRSTAAVERDEHGMPVRLMGTTRDVTENVLGREALSRVNIELEARVVERTGELQETVRELEAFSYTVAHDLRAPLRAIDGFSSCLGQRIGDAGAEETSALLTKIRRNVGSMDRLIDGLLNYARLGRQSFAPAPVDMSELAESVCAELAPLYPNVKITIDALPGTLGDAHMLRQVWSNLVANACKFSSAHANAHVAIGSTSHPEGTVYFVWDNGVGFDMRYSDRLFRVFERLHTSPEFAGSGVGLAIVQRIMQRHGGTAWAEGFPNEGATFYFRLPDRAGSP